MYRKTTSWSWFLWIASLCATILSANCANAQITPDRTLPNNSRVTPVGNTSIIEGGTQAGRNLFHSFQQFSIPTGSAAYFNNALDIQNIISRVTGGSVSNIDGLIRANGTANLFFLNPSGIIFGKNATLNVGGSFVATTANAIQFGNLGIFSASTPDAPSPLLTINPSALLFNQLPTGDITNRSQAPAGISPNGNNTTGLRVPDGNSLLLVGGNVNLDGGGLRAYGGRVELTGLAAPGSVGINVSGKTFSLNVPNGVQRTDVSLTNSSAISVFGAGGGDIAINAHNLEISNSSLFGGIGIGLGNVDTVAGDINLNATGAIKIAQGSQVENEVFTNGKGNAGSVLIQAQDSVLLENSDIFSNIEAGGVGKGGNIFITSGSFDLTDGSQLQSSILGSDASVPGGRGNSGNVNINVRDRVTLAGVNQNGNSSAIFTDVESGAVGKGGDIRITTGLLSLTNGAQLLTDTLGQGDAGNVLIKARDINFQGSILGSNGQNIGSGILTRVEAGATGNAGEVMVATGSLSISDGGTITTSTSGQGNAGNIFIDASDRVSLQNSAIINSSVEQKGVGQGGRIQIRTEALSLADLSFISSDTDGQGNAGSITINTAKLSITPSNPMFVGGISTSTTRQGNAGNITINARDTISIDNQGEISSSVLDSGSDSTGFAGKGQGGDIRITTGSLRLTNDAQLTTASTGQGDAGNIFINARDTVSLDGGSSSINTFVDSINGSPAVGRAGDIQITARSLFINGGDLSSATNGRGNAGNIDVRTTDEVVLDGGINNRFTHIDTGVLPDGVGRGGDIQITTGSLYLANNAVLFAATAGQGNSGNVIINARDRVSFSSGAQLQTYTNGQGNAGNVTIRTGKLSVDGVSPVNNQRSGIISAVEQKGVGRAGNIDITADSLAITNGGIISAFTSGRGQAGDITIKAGDRISVSGTSPNGQFRSVISTETDNTSTSDAGNLSIDTQQLSLSDGGYILASTFGQGKAGNIKIHAGDHVSLSGISLIGQFPSVIASVTGASGQGNSGSIFIDTPRLNLDNQAEINVTNFGSGEGGKIQVQVKTLGLNDRSQISAQTATTNGGDITLSVDDTLLLRRGSFISTNAGTTKAGGNGGNITINAPSGFVVAVPGENSDITANAFKGFGGRVQINATGIFGIAPLSRQDLERLHPLDLDPRQLPTNDITAVSQQNANLNGTVQINTPDIDPSRGLVILPTVTKNTSDPISSSCAAFNELAGGSKFIVTGRGGLAPSPDEPLTSDVVWSDTRLPATTLQQHGSQTTVMKRPLKSKPEAVAIVPATGWVFNNKGEVTLISSVSNATGLESTSVSCPRH